MLTMLCLSISAINFLTIRSLFIALRIPHCRLLRWTVLSQPQSRDMACASCLKL